MAVKMDIGSLHKYSDPVIMKSTANVLEEVHDRVEVRSTPQRKSGEDKT